MGMKLNLQLFSEEGTEWQQQESQAVPLELPLHEGTNSLQESAQEAAETAVEAIATIQAMEMQGMAAVLSQLKKIMEEHHNLLSSHREILQQVEALKVEALELVETLREAEAETHEPETNHEELTSGTVVEPIRQTGSGLKEALRKIL